MGGINDQRYKDKVRHGGKRAELLKLFGVKGKFQCAMCGVLGDSFTIVAHHVTGNKTAHEYQILLCRHCHAKLHDLGSKKRKDISKEQIEDALTKFKLLDDACKYLGITRSFLRKKRIEYGFPKRKVPNGMGVRQRKRKQM